LFTISYLSKKGPDPKDTLIDILATLEATPVVVGFQVIATNFDESVRTTNGKSSMLIYVVIPLNNYTMSNLKIFYNTIYEKGVNYAVSEYNISKKTYKKFPDKLMVLQYYLSIYPLII